MNKGIWHQIRETKPNVYKDLTKEELEESFNKIQENASKFRKKIQEMEKEHTKHFIKRSKELDEEIPMWLMLITSPSMNKHEGGVFMTGEQFYKVNEKWLKP